MGGPWHPYGRATAKQVGGKKKLSGHGVVARKYGPVRKWCQPSAIEFTLANAKEIREPSYDTYSLS